jgi:hypothetical protein
MGADAIDFSELKSKIRVHEELYQDDIELFSKAMLREMVANHSKGIGTPKLDLGNLKHEMQHHVNKLDRTIEAVFKDKGTSSEWLQNRILEFAADVANCAMFYANSANVLTPQRVEARKHEPDMMENNYESETKNDNKP